MSTSAASATAPGPRVPALRGQVAQTQMMEVLQKGYLHAVAAASGCALSAPSPDIHGVDWTVDHASPSHVMDSVATVKLQLKATHQISPKAIMGKPSFTLRIPSAQHVKLAQDPVTIDRLLVVMLVPRDIHRWVGATPMLLKVRHAAYWVNLRGHTTSSGDKTTVTVPTANVFDDLGLCDIMQRIGQGLTPR